MSRFSKRILLLAAASACLIAGFALTACGVNSNHEHVFGDWTTVSKATCETNGSRYHICTICNYREDVDIPALDHDYDSGTVTQPASCTEEGTRLFECLRCHTTKTEKIPKLDHNWDEGVIITPSTCTQSGKLLLTCLTCQTTEERDLFLAPHQMAEISSTPATCETDGVIHYACSVCGIEEDEILPATGHRWEATEDNIEPTCTEPGYRSLLCSLCQKTEKKFVPALGHSPAGDYTIDSLPSFYADGSKSRHCLRCDEKIDPTPIPMLREGQPVSFQFVTMRNNGDILTDSNILITVFDETTGQQVAQSSSNTLVGGVFTADLEPGSADAPKSYYATVQNLPAGYSAQPRYSVAPTDPRCNIFLTASPILAPAPAGTRYKLGSVMYDFTIPASMNASINNSDRDITLSELLKTKKAVVLNFFFTTCTPCQREFPYLMQAYRKYQNDIELIAIDEAGGESLHLVKQFAIEYNLICPVAYCPQLAIQSGLFGFTSVPQTVVIDSEGVICAIHSGSSSFEDFDNLFAPYSTQSSKTALPTLRATLPLRKKFFI